MFQVVEENVAFDPGNVSLLGAVGVVLAAQGLCYTAIIAEAGRDFQAPCEKCGITPKCLPRI